MAETRYVMTSKEFVEKAKWIATKIKTLYVMGCFGAPLNAKGKARYTKNHSYNRKPERTAMINAATDDTFGFDCNCLIKGILWGFNGDKTKSYGGAQYGSNDVPDCGITTMRTYCVGGTSTDMTNIEPGEAVFMSKDEHIGIYIGDGLVVESTPAWDNKVQIRGLNKKVGNYGKSNKFTSHGKLLWINYETKTEKKTTLNTLPSSDFGKPINEVADDVIKGRYGNGATRKTKLREAGYDPSIVQNLVNMKCYNTYNKKDVYYPIYFGKSTDVDLIIFTLAKKNSTDFIKKIFARNGITFTATKADNMALLTKLKEGTVLKP